MTKLFISLLLLQVMQFAQAQSVGIGTPSPNASAQLDITSTTKGLLIPRMTSAQRLAITTPAAGLMVYETTTSSFWFYNGSVWNQIGTGGVSPWTVSGTSIYNSNTGNVGIGISAPLQKFHLLGDFQQDNGAVILNNAGAIVQFQNAGVNKLFLQQSGNNLRIGTNSGNELGKIIFRMDNSDKIFIDSTGNMQIIGEQDASLTAHGYLTLGSLSGNNIIIDNNEIMARNNGAADNLILQNDGGNVGIGVASPDERLTLTNNIKLNGAAGLIKFETAVGGTGAPISSLRYAPGLQFLREGTTTNLAKIEYVDTANFANFIRLRMGSNIENGITLNSSNHTGLGTNDPLARLHVKGEAGIDEIAINSGTALSSETAAIQFYSSALLGGGGAAAKKGFMLLDGDDIKVGTNSGNTAGRFIIRTDGADRIFVDEAGIVSIGTQTNAPGYKLRLGGKMICEEVKVKLQGNWPDYVFDKHYKLPSFSELEKYIAANHHLPSFAPASDIQQNGFELGDMQKRLLEKVEELTLYILQLNNEIESLKKVISPVK
jgi:hypothetical protein